MPNPAYLCDVKQHASGYHAEPCLPVWCQTICQWLPCRTLPTCTTSSSIPVATIPNPAYLYNIKQYASGYHAEIFLPIRNKAACQWLPYQTLPTCTTSSSMPAATILNPAYLYDIKQHASGYHTKPCLHVRHQTACQWLPYRILPTCTISSSMLVATPVQYQAACQWLPYRTLPTGTTSSNMPEATIPNPAYLYDIKQHASGYHTEPCLPIRHQATCQRLPYRTLPTCTTSSSMPANIIPNPAVKNGKNTCRPICHDDSSGTPDINCPFVFPPPKHAQQTLDFSRSGRLESMSSLLCTSGPWCMGVVLADMSSRPGVPYSCFGMLWNTDDAKSGC